MRVDHIIGGFVTQGMERQSWDDDSTYLVRLQIPIPRESTCSR